MAKKVTGMIKLQLAAGKATPAPPVGPALGQHGVNIMGFCKEFNAKTANQAGLIIPVVITVYQDRSFSFILKTPPAAVLIKKELGLESGSGVPNRTKVGKLTKELKCCYNRSCYEHDRRYCKKYGCNYRRVIHKFVGGLGRYYHKGGLLWERNMLKVQS